MEFLKFQFALKKKQQTQNNEFMHIDMHERT